MARKKSDPIETPPVEKPTRARRAKATEPAPEPQGESKPARSRSKKPAPATEPQPVAELEAQPEPETKKPVRARAKRAPAAPAAEPVAEEVKPKRTSRARKTAPVESAAPEPQAAAEAAPKPARSRSRRPAKPAVDAESDPVLTMLPEPVWRTPARKAAKAAEPKPVRSARKSKDPEPITAAEALQPDEERRGRRRRRGRGRAGQADEPQVSEAVEVVPEIPADIPLPKFRPAKTAPPKDPHAERKLIRVPEDAPQVIVRQGVPTLIQNKQVIPPVFFFGSSLEEKNLENVLEQVRMAAENGIHTFVHFVEFVVDRQAVEDSVSFAAFMLAKTLEADPEAKVLYRVVFTAPRGWEKRYAKAKYVAEDGGLAEPSVSDDEFWSEAEHCLQDFIRQLRMLETSDHILGIHLERGEWFFADGWGYDTSIAAHEKFRDWVRVRYRDDVVALRAAWFDGQVQFATVSVPEFRQEARAGEEFVRMGRKTRRWVDYHLFMSDITVQRIGKLAYAVKQASDGYFLVGASYGYTFEWSHPASGHLSLGKLLRSPEVDFIAGPPSYRNREPGGSAPFPGPIDSFALNGKLYISEEDFKTPISGADEPDDFNPVMRTPQALESAHWRGVGAALAHSSGVCWMDLWGNGWLNSPGIWQRSALVRDALVRRMASEPVEPDVAVFIDERSLAYLVDKDAFKLLVQNVRESVLRSGMSAAFYLLSDLAHRENFPESKLYVFMNAWDIRPEVRAAIKNRLQRDGKVLFWLNAAGLFDGGRDALERVREVTGIALKKQPFASKAGTALLNRRHPLAEALPEKLLGTGGLLEPSYFAIPEDSLVLGEYSQTGLPSFVVKEMRSESDPKTGWTSVFLGEPVVTPALFRALGQMAKAHVWNYHEDVVHVRAPFLSVHCQGAGMRTVTLPDRWSAYSVLTGDWAVTDSTHLRFNATDGSTHTFLVGIRSEIEALLAKDSTELLSVDEVPDRPENTIRMDAFTFDVPIMKLDEWMDEGLSEDVVEDLLLKPSQLAVEVEEAREEQASPSSSRRRRRRRGRGGGSEETATRRKEGVDQEMTFEDISVNVLFRKRE